MDHVNLLKRAFLMTWRYRALWLFGFFLALCSGGIGGGGNFNPPTGGGEDFGMPANMPSIGPAEILTILIILICLGLVLALVGVVVRAVTRTALFGMVRQVAETEQITIREGWRFGWSSRAWRVFLIGLIFGIPLAIIGIALIIIAFLPLLLLFTEETALMILGVILFIAALLFVIVLLMIIGAVISPFMELSWRRTALDEEGVLDSLGQTFGFIRQHLKDVVIVWLLLIGVGLLWVVLALVVVLPAALIVGAFVGGIPGLLVYLISGSLMGALITGGPLAVLAMIIVTSFLTGLYYIFHSAVWTLTHLELQTLPPSPDPAPSAGQSSQTPPTSSANVSPDG